MLFHSLARKDLLTVPVRVHTDAKIRRQIEKQYALIEERRKVNPIRKHVHRLVGRNVMSARESHDAPAKKIARLMTWWTIQKLIPEFTKQRYLVLVGEEAGDVGVLLGLGVPLGHIAAVDFDKDAVASARKKYPGLGTGTYDVEQLQPEVAYACAFLDFCGYMTPKTLGKAVTTAKNCVRDNGIFTCNFQVGREVALHGELTNLRHDYENTLEDVDAWEGIEIFLARADLLQNELWERGLDQGLVILPKEFIFYQGRTETWKGQPFCTYIATVRRADKKKIEFFKRRKLPQPKFSLYEGDLLTLRDYALDLAKAGERADLLLNVTTSTIAAWKAHETRGTYKK
jgi:hypothetical protein